MLQRCSEHDLRQRRRHLLHEGEALVWAASVPDAEAKTNDSILCACCER